MANQQPELCPIPGATFDLAPPEVRDISGASFDSAPPETRSIEGAAFANPVITSQPDPRYTVADGAEVELSVTCTGEGTLAYQWFKDGAAIDGATAATQTVTASAATAGSYTCKITSDYGDITTVPALIEIE